MDEQKKCAQCEGAEFADAKCVGCGADEPTVEAPVAEEAAAEAAPTE